MADRRLANGTVNAAQFGEGPAIVLLHSLLSDRASFDSIVPSLAKTHRVIVPELPGFGGSDAVSGGLAAVADRVAEAVRDCGDGADTIVLGNGYGGFVALQMAIRHPGIAGRLVLADCGAAFSESGREAFRNMATAASTKGLPAVTDVAMRRLFAAEFQEQNPELMRDRREAFCARIPACFRVPASPWRRWTSGLRSGPSKCRCWYWSASTMKRRHHRCPESLLPDYLMHG